MLEPWLGSWIKTKFFFLKLGKKKLGGQLEKLNRDSVFLKCYEIVDSFLRLRSESAR